MLILHSLRLILIHDSSGDLTLYPVHKNAQGGPLEYVCDPQQPIRLQGAHGEEIVRDLVTDVHVSIVRSYDPTMK